MAPAFSKPRHLQQSSRLCQLPAEIRLIILRDLLIFPDCTIENQLCRNLVGFNHRALVQPSPESVQSTNRQLQKLVQMRVQRRSNLAIAQCAQLMYTDAIHILYNENLLTLSFDTCEIMTSLPGVYGDASGLINGNRGRTVDPSVIVWAQLPCYTYTSNYALTLSKRFERYMNQKVIFKGPKHRSAPFRPEAFRMLAALVARTCQCFRPILLEKNVDFVFEGYWPDFKHEDGIMMLAGCKVLECNNFTINGKPAPVDIAKYVNGSEKVHDTYSDWGTICTSILHQLPSYEHKMTGPRDRGLGSQGTIGYFAGPGSRKEMFISRFRDQLRKVEEIALRYDVEAFQKEAKIVLREAQKWTNAWVEAETHKIIKQRRLVMKSSKETESSLGGDLMAQFYEGVKQTTIEDCPDGSGYTYEWDAEE